MKRTTRLLILILLILGMTGCSVSSSNFETNEAVQILADRSALAKEYASPLFDEYMESQSIENYTIEQTAYGFYTSETPNSVYVVGFRYTSDDVTGMYGYKIVIDENDICSVLEESREVAAFLFGEEK